MSDKSENQKKSGWDSHYHLQKSDVTISEKNHHVIPRDGGWAVRREGSSRDIVRTGTQGEAISRAREIAKTKGTEVIVHNRDGKIVGRGVLRVNEWELEPVDTALINYIDSTLYGERPHIRGRRVLVSLIAANAQENQWSNSRLAEEFSLSEEVLAALLYYREHKAEIDRQDAEEQKQFDEMYCTASMVKILNHDGRILFRRIHAPFSGKRID